MAGAVHDEVSAEAADDRAHAGDALAASSLLDVDGRLGAEIARGFSAAFGAPTRPPGGPLLRRGDGEMLIGPVP
jgi:hypothetical protein